MSKYTLLQNVVRFAEKHSDDPRTKVGACLVHDHKHTVGANRFYSLPENKTKEEVVNDRELKLQYVTHAEVDALSNCDNAKDGTLYVNYVPCDKCAKRIIESGVKKVIALDHSDDLAMVERWGKYWEIGRQMFRENGIELVEQK